MGKRSCDSCKNASTSPTCYPCCDCDSDSNKYEPQTNADRIRNMSDEELAELLEDVRTHGFTDLCCDDNLCDSDACDCCVHEWLQAEVKEGNPNENT